ncbi:MAG: hypothetical protein EBR91_11860, partial [Flavobacteriia bacterium]|nr:hypothetical protein [Flavobacteriia bacterium]
MAVAIAKAIPIHTNIFLTTIILLTFSVLLIIYTDTGIINLQVYLQSIKKEPHGPLVLVTSVQ